MATLVAGGGCLLLRVHHPRTLHPQAWHRPAKVQAPVAIVVDHDGVSHIFADSTRDVVQGLGYMHGRERLFQVDLIRRAATGRLAELFGRDLLALDRRLRILSYRLDEAVAALGDDELALIDAYLAGLHEAAQDMDQPTFEHRMLGAAFTPMQRRDVLAIARLQSWDLSMDYEMELLRAELRHVLGPRAEDLLPDIPAAGVPIVPSARAQGTASGPAPVPSPTLPPEAVDQLSLTGLQREIRERLGLDLGAASNSYVVSAARSMTGSPLLENDTHLPHRVPGVFYLTHLVTPDFDVIGYTFPGIPAVLIGSTPDLSWGFTTSYVDVEDVYRIVPAPGTLDGYLLDGVATPYQRWDQSFQIGHGENPEVETLEYRATVFGPLLNPGREDRLDAAAPHALAWAGFATDEDSAHLIRSFFELYRSRDVATARHALRRAGLVFQNLVLATTSGDIAYALLGSVPRRAPDHDGSLLQDGSTRRHLWQGWLGDDELPFVLNPPEGVIVAANQRVRDEPRGGALGAYASHPYRAQRLHELLASKPRLSGADLRRFWTDSESVQPRRTLAAILAQWPVEHSGKPTSSQQRQAHMREVLVGWDHRHGSHSVGATVYDAVYDALKRACFEELLGGATLERYLDSTFSSVVLDAALEAVARGDDHPLLRAVGAPRSWIGRAVERSERLLRAQLGPDVATWTWGRRHTLTFKHPLGIAWPLDSLLNIGPYEVPGCWSCVACEVGTPVVHGASMRTVVEVSAPRRVHMILDTGNAGYAASDNYDNMARRFVRGAALEMPLTRQTIEARAAGRIALLPASQTARFSPPGERDSGDQP
ncbi:MAG: penicillin acylase family protein [Pseudomonadota bacterium]